MKMSDPKEKQKSEADAALEREIREGRKFTLEEAIGRLAGPGGMKGESPIAQMQQAELEIEAWLRSHLTDAGGVLAVVLHRAVKGSDLLLQNYEQPLVVLASCCQRALRSESLLQELVRTADTEWGRMMGERPYFNKPGAPPHPNDPYTAESVRQVLTDLLNQLATEVDSPT